MCRCKRKRQASGLMFRVYGLRVIASSVICTDLKGLGEEDQNSAIGHEASRACERGEVV